MNRSQPKRHHIVPRFILENFVDNLGNLHVFTKNPRRRFQAKPNNAFAEKYMYSIQHEDGTKDQRVENKLAEEEGDAAPVISKIIDVARQRRSLDIGLEEKRALLKFWRVQHRRSRHIRGAFSGSEYLDLALPLLEAMGVQFSESDRESLRQQATDDRECQNAFAGNVAEDLPEHSGSMKILLSRGIGTVVIENARKSFVIGDQPIVRYRNRDGDLRLGDPGAYELFPVAHDVAIRWGLLAFEAKRIVLDDISLIRQINEISLEQSTMIAGRSPELIQSLSDTSAARVAPRIYDMPIKRHV